MREALNSWLDPAAAARQPVEVPSEAAGSVTLLAPACRNAVAARRGQEWAKPGARRYRIATPRSCSGSAGGLAGGSWRVLHRSQTSVGLLAQTADAADSPGTPSLPVRPAWFRVRVPGSPPFYLFRSSRSNALRRAGDPPEAVEIVFDCPRRRAGGLGIWEGCLLHYSIPDARTLARRRGESRSSGLGRAGCAPFPCKERDGVQLPAGPLELAVLPRERRTQKRQAGGPHPWARPQYSKGKLPKPHRMNAAPDGHRSWPPRSMQADGRDGKTLRDCLRRRQAGRTRAGRVLLHSWACTNAERRRCKESRSFWGRGLTAGYAGSGFESRRLHQQIPGSLFPPARTVAQLAVAVSHRRCSGSFSVHHANRPRFPSLPAGSDEPEGSLTCDATGRPSRASIGSGSQKATQSWQRGAIDLCQAVTAARIAAGSRGNLRSIGRGRPSSRVEASFFDGTVVVGGHDRGFLWKPVDDG